MACGHKRPCVSINLPLSLLYSCKVRERGSQRLFFILSYSRDSSHTVILSYSRDSLFMLFPFLGTFLPNPPPPPACTLPSASCTSHAQLTCHTVLEFLSSPLFPQLSWGHSSGSQRVCFGAPHCAICYTPRFRLSILGEQGPCLVSVYIPNT